MVTGNDPKLFYKFVSYCDYKYKSPSDNGPDNTTNNCNLFFDLHLMQHIALIPIPSPNYLQLYDIYSDLNIQLYMTVQWSSNKMDDLIDLDNILLHFFVFPVGSIDSPQPD